MRFLAWLLGPAAVFTWGPPLVAWWLGSEPWFWVFSLNAAVAHALTWGSECYHHGLRGERWRKARGQ